MWAITQVTKHVKHKVFKFLVAQLLYNQGISVVMFFMNERQEKNSSINFILLNDSLNLNIKLVFYYFVIVFKRNFVLYLEV